MNYQQIVWLASYPKSGNTWLRCFLDAYLTGEVDINNLVSSVTDDNAARCLPGDGSDPSEFPIDVQMLVRPMGLLRLVRQFELNKEETGLDIPLFVKTHNAHMIPNGVELLPFPLTKAVICIVRDPRDVLVSYAKHMGGTIDEALEWFFDKYRVLTDERRPKMADFISSWKMNVQSYANADTHNVRVFRYEDMKEKPLETFSGMLEHAGLSVDESRVQMALDAVQLSKLQKQEKEHGFKESSPFHKDKFFGSGEGWRNVLNPRQIRQVEKGCASMMKRFNYEFAIKRVA